MGRSDHRAVRGEAIAVTRLTEICRKNDLPYFEPHYLGEKCPVFDYLVDLVDAGVRQPFFFVQVKSTGQGYTTTGSPRRLKVRIDRHDVRRMSRYPAPTYVIGVDERQERAFIIGVYGDMAGTISSISTAHELTCATLRKLWLEVRAFWRARNMRRKTSAFVN